MAKKQNIVTTDYTGEDRRNGMANSNGWNTAQFLFNILVTIMMVIGGWHINLTMDMMEKYNVIQTEVEVIKGNRFTAQDASNMQLGFLTAIDNLSKNVQQLAINMAQIPKEIPPQWFKDYVVETRKDLVEHLNKHPRKIS